MSKAMKIYDTAAAIYFYMFKNVLMRERDEVLNTYSAINSSYNKQKRVYKKKSGADRRENFLLLQKVHSHIIYTVYI